MFGPYLSISHMILGQSTGWLNLFATTFTSSGFDFLQGISALLIAYMATCFIRMTVLCDGVSSHYVTDINKAISQNLQST